MKILFFDAKGQVFVNPAINGVEFSDLRGSAYVFDKSDLLLLRYSRERYFSTHLYKGKPLQVFLQPNLSLSASHEKLFDEGGIFFTDLNGVEIDLPIEAAFPFFYSFGGNKEYFIGEYTESNILKLIVFNMVDESFQTYEDPISPPTHYLDGEFYILGTGYAVLAKLNKDIQIDWIVQDKTPNVRGHFSERMAHIFEQGEALVANFSMVSTPISKTDGKLLSVDKRDGSENWHTMFDFPISECQRLNTDQLILYSGGLLYVVNANDGTIVQSAPTQLEALLGVSLVLTERYLYLFSKEDQCVQIMDKTDFASLRVLNTKQQGWGYHKEPQVIDDKIFIRMTMPSEFAGWLVIDESDIHAPLEIERGPDIDLTLPSDESGSIVMHVDHPNWGDVVRFAEWHGMQAVSDASKDWRHLDYNKYFNGKIHLEYSGYQDSKEVVEEKMLVLKERFEHYAKTNNYNSGNWSKAKDASEIQFSYNLV